MFLLKISKQCIEYKYYIIIYAFLLVNIHSILLIFND